MAEYMTPQEYEEFLRVTKENYEAGYITARQYNEAQKDAAAGIRGYTASLEASMKQLGTSFKAMGKDIYSGKQGVGQFGGAIESGADAVAAYAKKFGPAGMALGMFTQAVSKFVTASLKMSDQLFESFQKISRTGTVGAGAMSEVYDQMQKLGYTMDSLDNLGGLLARNSKNFGLFFQSALQGSRAFGQVANQIQNSELRQQFFRLGMSVDDINDGIAGYVAQQGKLGQIQGKSVDQLAKGSEAYIKELDILTKLTGMTRQEQEDAREQALQIEAFYAGLADLGEKQQEEALKAFTMMYAKGGPKAAAEMASQFNGVITAASDMFLTTGGASMQAFSKEFFAKGGTAAQSAQMIKDSISPDMARITQDLNKLGVSLGLNFRTIQNLTKDGMVPLEKLAKELTDEQFKQLTGMDKATASQASARDSQIKTAQNLQDFVKMGVGPATAALEIFTQAVEYLTSFIPGAGRAKGLREDAAATKAGKTTARQDNVAAVQSGSNLGVLTYNTDADNEALRSSPAYQAERASLGGGPPGVAPEDYVAFTSGTGDRAHFGQLLPSVQAQFLEMAKVYNQMTGKKLQVNSAFRSPDEQAAVDPGSNPKAAPGMSLHQAGRALDIQSDQRAYLESKGLLVQHGFRPLAGDPPHISAANGAILSGPMSGYQPNLTMHGTEAVVPLNTAAQQSAAGMMDNSIMSAQLGRLEEMVGLMKNQLSVSTKIMQYSS
jgi:hypothetical protein